LTGISLRQMWTWVCVLLVAAYSSIVKSILIKQPDQKFITQYQDIVTSGVPVTCVAESMDDFDKLQYSPFSFDRWLHDNADVLTWRDP